MTYSTHYPFLGVFKKRMLGAGWANQLGNSWRRGMAVRPPSCSRDFVLHLGILKVTASSGSPALGTPAGTPGHHHRSRGDPRREQRRSYSSPTVSLCVPFYPTISPPILSRLSSFADPEINCATCTGHSEKKQPLQLSPV